MAIHENMIQLCYIGLVALTVGANFVLIPINVNLVSTSFFIIYIGSCNLQFWLVQVQAACAIYPENQAARDLLFIF
jgi:hypothetical protein